MESEAEHLAAVADARFLMRRAFRIVDEEARRAGIDPLANQLLVQLRGAGAYTRSMSELTMRLDVPLALTSRIARDLERRALVVRRPSESDGRVTLVTLTDAGSNLAVAVGDRARHRFAELRDTLSDDRRLAAIRVWAGNFGVDQVVGTFSHE